MRGTILILGMSILFAGCEKLPLSNGHSDLLVVQGYLYAGLPVDSIRLSQPVYFNSEDTLFSGVSNASVSIVADGVIYVLQPAQNQGYYFYPGSDLNIIAGHSYTLTIGYNNQQITSQTTVPSNPSGLAISENTLWVDTTQTQRELRDSSLLVSWSNPGNDYYFVILENLDTVLTPITVSSGFGGYGGSFPTGTVNLQRRFQTRPIQDSLYRVSLFSSVGNYGHYLLRLYKVTKDYANLYQSRTQNSLSLNEPFTNISNGLGIFTAFSACDSVAFSVQKK